MDHSRKVYLVTGASSGIGLQMALGLARTGGTVGLICRDTRKAEEAKQLIFSKTNNNNVQIFTADLAEQAQIRKLADDIKKSFSHIDVLINNAATAASRLIVTSEGIELQLAVNYLSAFLLSNLLLPQIQKAEQGRIINVTSRSHKRGGINFDDINFSKNYSGPGAYNQSKLAIILFTYEMARRLSNTTITVNCFHPGLVNTEFGHKNTNAFHHLLWTLQKPLGRSVEKGAETGIYLATSAAVSKITGAYFADKHQIRSSEESYDAQLAKKLWLFSENLTRLSS